MGRALYVCLRSELLELLIKYRSVWFNCCPLESLPLPLAWSSRVVHGFLRRGGRIRQLQYALPTAVPRIGPTDPGLWLQMNAHSVVPWHMAWLCLVPVWERKSTPER